MINKDKCILLGTLAKPHGTKGSLLIRFSGLKAEEFRDKGLVFIEIDGLPVPFFVESFQEKTDVSAILKLEGIDSETKAREFAGCSVFVMKDQVKGKTIALAGTTEIRGYRVSDIHLGFIGFAEKITNLPTNPLLLVKRNDKEYLIPVHENIIRYIDKKQGLIQIDAPDGLFEI